jgi:Leucine-rich repeat (LRR) protein
LEESLRAVGRFTRVIASAFALLTGCGGTSEEDLEKVDIGDCLFEDQGVELEVRKQILEADQLDGRVDGSVGPESVTYLHVSQETLSLSGLECLANLEDLNLEVHGEVADPISLAPIAGLTHLVALWLNGPFELSGALDGLELELLSLTEVPLTDLEEIATQTELRVLRLEAVPLTSLKGAEPLTSLESLRITGAELTDLSPLAETWNLTEIELRDLPGLTSLAGLEPHTRLKQLRVSDVPIESLAPLARGSDLEEVGVWTSQISSLEGLEGKVELTTVHVSDAKVSDLSAVSGLPALSVLILPDNAIDDLTALSTCTALTSLDVSGNSIESLAPLGSLVALTHLYAADNALTAIDVDLPAGLTGLSIANNHVTSLAPLAGLPIGYLDISSNPLESLAPLFDLPELSALSANHVGATTLSAFPLGILYDLDLQNNQIQSVDELHGLGELSVDLTGNDVVSLPENFVGPSAVCGGGLTLLDNPLNDAAKARLQQLCEQGSASYAWDGGECNRCPNARAATLERAENRSGRLRRVRHGENDRSG